MLKTGLKRALRFFMAAIATLTPALLMAQFHEIKHDSINAYGWFGGDDRPAGGPRHVGITQSVRIDTALTVNTFAFYFRGPFDFAGNPEDHGHEVTLILNVRDAAGSVLKTLQVVLADTFSVGWVTWSGIEVDADGDDTLLFSSYLVGALDTAQYTAGYGADLTQSYADGELYGKHGASDLDMESWSDWSPHPSWDGAFRLQGTVRDLTSVGESGGENLVTFDLSQNYPNPFNPSTTITYSLEAPEFVELSIYNSLGQLVRMLVNQSQPAGHHRQIWDGRNHAGDLMSSGVYFYRLQVGGRGETRRMLFLK
jgi:hypothetical protein